LNPFFVVCLKNVDIRYAHDRFTVGRKKEFAPILFNCVDVCLWIFSIVNLKETKAPAIRALYMKKTSWKQELNLLQITSKKKGNLSLRNLNWRNYFKFAKRVNSVRILRFWCEKILGLSAMLFPSSALIFKVCKSWNSEVMEIEWIRMEWLDEYYWIF
jgi:hypothetical protein